MHINLISTSNSTIQLSGRKHLNRFVSTLIKRSAEYIFPINISFQRNNLYNRAGCGRLQHIMETIEQAVEDYNNTDRSNTFNSVEAALMMRTCYMGFDPMSPSAELPAMFTRDFGAFLQNYVVLQDPNKNQIRVAIERKDCKFFFTHGWSRLRDFYDIGIGAWLTILYISPVLFHLRIRKRTGGEVEYPQRNPPYSFMLLDHLSEPSLNGPVPYFLAPRVFCHALQKDLTASDVDSGNLTLCWDGFCNQALPSKPTKLTLIDWLGCTWECNLEFQNAPPTNCIISGQWRNLCRARSLSEGSTVKFGVTNPSNNRIVHVKVSPFIGVRTTLVAAEPNGRHRAFYQTTQYFML